MGVANRVADGVALANGTTTVKATAGIVYNITLQSGTAASSLVLRDGGAGGAIKYRISLILTAAAGDQSHSVSFPAGLNFTTDITAVIAGAAATGAITFS